MNSEEIKQQFDTLLPAEVNGSARPSEPLSSDNDFYLDVPQLIRNDVVLADSMNLIISTLLSNDKVLNAMIDAIKDQLASADLREATQLLKGLMSPDDKKKLDGIANNSNNYSHPNSGVTSGTYKSVTVNAQGHVTGGSNPTTLAGYGITDAAAKSHGNHVPATQTADNTKFLRNDNTWQQVTPGNIGAPTKTGGGASGTWNINVSGKAATAGTADTAKACTGNSATATNATNATNAYSFSCGAYGNETRYRVFASCVDAIGSGHNSATIILSQAGNYGASRQGVWLIQMSTRGSRTMAITALQLSEAPPTFGYYVTGGRCYFGMHGTTFAGDCSVTVLGNNSFSIGKLYDSTAQPSGWTPVQPKTYSNQSAVITRILAGQGTKLWEKVNGLNAGNITLSQAFTNFSYMVVFGSKDGGTDNVTAIVHETAALYQAMQCNQTFWNGAAGKNNSGNILLMPGYNSLHWGIYNVKGGSTTTYLKYRDDDESYIYSIYGIN